MSLQWVSAIPFSSSIFDKTSKIGVCMYVRLELEYGSLKTVQQLCDTIAYLPSVFAIFYKLTEELDLN